MEAVAPSPTRISDRAGRTGVVERPVDGSRLAGGGTGRTSHGNSGDGVVVDAAGSVVGRGVVVAGGGSTVDVGAVLVEGGSVLGALVDGAVVVVEAPGPTVITLLSVNPEPGCTMSIFHSPGGTARFTSKQNAPFESVANVSGPNRSPVAWYVTKSAIGSFGG